MEGIMARWIGSICLAGVLLSACAAVSGAKACVGTDCDKGSFGAEPQAVIPRVVLPEDMFGQSINKIDVPVPVDPDGVVVPIAETNTCALAFNNVCDDPGKCPPGTDAHDCSTGSRK
jgi:hypothetical protein